MVAWELDGSPAMEAQGAVRCRRLSGCRDAGEQEGVQGSDGMSNQRSRGKEWELLYSGGRCMGVIGLKQNSNGWLRLGLSGLDGD